MAIGSSSALALMSGNHEHWVHCGAIKTYVPSAVSKWWSTSGIRLGGGNTQPSRNCHTRLKALQNIAKPSLESHVTYGRTAADLLDAKTVHVWGAPLSN